MYAASDCRLQSPREREGERERGHTLNTVLFCRQQTRRRVRHEENEISLCQTHTHIIHGYHQEGGVEEEETQKVESQVQAQMGPKTAVAVLLSSM